MNRRDVLIGATAAALATGARAAAPTAAVVPMRGLWRREADACAVGRFPEFGQDHFVFDYGLSRVTPFGATAGNAAAQQKPPADVRRDGADLLVGGRRLSPVRIDRRPFSVAAENAVLSAEIARPLGARPIGSIVMIYGSGPAPKEAFDLWSFWFLNAGFAVLSYDKRGSGRSTGDWRVVGLETLARDAHAVIATARAAGLAASLYAWGASQAGWIMPQLGAAGLVDGIVMHAGSALRPRDQIMAQVEAELRAYGFAEAEISRAKTYYALDMDVSRGVRPWADVMAAYDAAKAAGAEWLLGPPAAADAPERTMIRLMTDFDPSSYWRANRAPTLALFGDKDWIVPAEPNMRTLKEMVAPDTALTSMVLPSANHLMFAAETGLREEYPTLSHIHPRYFAEIANWLNLRR